MLLPPHATGVRVLLVTDKVLRYVLLLAHDCAVGRKGEESRQLGGGRIRN
jgi:hypothetical protein